MNLNHLNELFVEYRKNRDLLFRKISKIEINQTIVIFFKNNNQEVASSFLKVEDSLDFLAKHEKNDFLSLVFYNTRQNVKDLIKNWAFLVDYVNLTIYFFNDKSLTDFKWIIKPYVHDKVIESKDLKLGIESLASGVDYVV